MSYPTSTDVVAGQPTAAAHYNNLRLDALYLGNLATDSDLLANLLSAYQSGLTLQYLATNKVRVPASTAAPVRLMVGGVMLSAAANVDLAAAPAGGAMTYYVFAVRTAGSTTFTLAINASATESATTRLIGQFYWTGTAVTLIQTKQRQDILAQTFMENSQACQGRLTLTSATPVTTSDVTTASTLYFSPFGGNCVSLWETGIGWRTWYFNELSLNISTYTANKNYDIFLCNNAGTLTLEGLVWTSDSARATAVVLQDGRYVKSGDPTRLYLGTIRITSVTGQCEDSQVKRFVWNLYNQVNRRLFCTETTAHSYLGTDRKWNNSDTNNKLEFVEGLLLHSQVFTVTVSLSCGTDTTVNPALISTNTAYYFLQNGNQFTIQVSSSFSTDFAPGYNFQQVYETQPGAAAGSFYRMSMFSLLMG